jgi:hypothetical protein
LWVPETLSLPSTWRFLRSGAEQVRHLAAGIGWVAGLHAVIGDAASRPYSFWQANAANVRLGRFESRLFTTAEQAEFPHGQQRTAESLVATIATHARVLVLPEPEQARLLATFRAYLDARPETSGGEFMLPIVTTVIRTTRR